MDKTLVGEQAVCFFLTLSFFFILAAHHCQGMRSSKPLMSRQPMCFFFMSSVFFFAVHCKKVKLLEQELASQRIIAKVSSG